MQETQETRVWPLGGGDPLEEGMATHSSTLAWRIPWTEEPGGLQSMGVTQSRTGLTQHAHLLEGAAFWMTSEQEPLRPKGNFFRVKCKVNLVCINFRLIATNTLNKF